MSHGGGPIPSTSNQPERVRTLDELFSNMALDLGSFAPLNGHRMGPNRSHPSAHRGYPTPPRTPAGQYQRQENGGGHRGRSQRSRAEFQFWPQAMAMGSLVGKKFIQVSSVLMQM